MPEPDTTPDTSTGHDGAVLAGVALLHDLTRWREQLARSIARNNLALRSEQIATAVNQIICRLFFLRIAEDRSLIEAGTFERLSGDDDAFGIIMNGTQSLDELFLDLFPTTSPPGAGSDTLMESLVLEESVMKKIVQNLSAPERLYHFAGIRTETIAEVFGQYLRQTIRRSATQQATVIDTHDTVLSRFANTPGNEAIEYLVQATLRTGIAYRSRREVLPLRIVDPACGAGHVLLFAFGALTAPPGRSRYTFEERRQVLAESIHGVDGSPYAVAVARLLLLFKLCEGENARSLPGNFFTVATGVLWELRMAIRCGNALIGPDIVRDESWTFCPARERHQLNLFEWQLGFPEIFTSGGFDVVISNPLDGPLDTREWIQQYFQRHYSSYDPAIDRSAYFVEKGISLLRNGGTLGYCMSDRWLRRRDGAALRSVLLKTQLEEIVDFVGTGEKRTGQGLCVLRLTNRSPSGSFMVTLADPGWPEVTDARDTCGTLAEYVAVHRFPVDNESLDVGGWALRDTRSEGILAKVRGSGTTLADYVMDQIFSGTAVAPDTRFVIDEATRLKLISEDPRCRQFIRPLVSGNEIERYSLKQSQHFVIVIPRGWTLSHSAASSSPWRWFKRRHLALARFLRQRAADEPEKLPGKQDDIWWEHPTGRGSFANKDSGIFFAGSFEAPSFVFDEGWAVPDETTGIIASSSPYLVGILNSRLIAFVLRHSQPAGHSRFYSGEDLRELPIYTPDFEKQEDIHRYDRMVLFVVRLIALKRHLRHAKTDADRQQIQKKIVVADNAIDSIVYELYGLTATEIAVVESQLNG